MARDSFRRTVLCFALLLLIWAFSCGRRERTANDRPNTADITDSLSIRIPTYFSISDVKIEGQANDINPGQLFGGFSFSDWAVVIGRGPDEVFMKTIFSFTAMANEPLFEAVRQIGNTSIIREVTEKGESGTLECVAGSKLHGDALVTSIIDCGALPAGQPRSYIAQDACVERSSCEKAAENALLAQMQQLRNSLLGIWHGRYIYGQGETGVDVSLTEMTDSGAIRGTFSFFNMPGMHNAASGKFVITGKFDSSSNSLHVDPAGWISNPANWVALGFSASPNADWTHLEGNITGGRCGQIFLNK